MTKGKLLTTPSRMLNLILPFTTMDANSDRKDMEPLALLVHPQQPLSYLERLIQSELPTIKDGDKERIPNVYFRAEDSMQDTIEPKKFTPVEDGENEGFEKPREGKHDFEKVGKCGLMTRRSGLASLITNLPMKRLLYEAVMAKVG